MKFNNNDQEAQEAKEFIQRALRRHFRGDMQELFNHFPAFMDTEAVKTLINKYEELQAEVYQAWELEAFDKAQDKEDFAESAEIEIVVESHQDHVSELEFEESENSSPEMPSEIHISDDLPEFDPDQELNHNDAENEQVSEQILDQDETEADPEGENEDAQSENEMKDSDNENTSGNATPSGPPVIPVRLVFNNGKTGVEYGEKIDLSALNRPLESLIKIEANGFEAAGLSFDEETLKIVGVPAEAGKFRLSIRLEYEATIDRPAQIYRLEGDLDILPDPRNLWKELEPDPELPYPKPHKRFDNLQMWGRSMIAASRRGRSHAHGGTFRDDDYALAINENEGWYIIAVADGAGSAPFSRKGSQLACDKSVEEIQSKLNADLSRELESMASAYNSNPSDQLRQQIRSRIYEPLSHSAYAGYKAITNEAEKIGQPVKAFHTTLMLTIVKQFDFGYFVGTWWVGDGGVGVYQRGKKIKIMGSPDGGEFAGQTRFLTMPEIWTDGATVLKRIEFDIVEDFTAVVLMSDGITDPKIGTDFNLGQVAKWDELWDDLNESVDFGPNNLNSDEQLLEWLDFWAPGEHDDRTIAILY